MKVKKLFYRELRKKYIRIVQYYQVINSCDRLKTVGIGVKYFISGLISVVFTMLDFIVVVGYIAVVIFLGVLREKL